MCAVLIRKKPPQIEVGVMKIILWWTRIGIADRKWKLDMWKEYCLNRHASPKA